MLAWLYTGIQRMQAGFNSFVQRMYGSAGTVGPTIVHTFSGN